MSSLPSAKTTALAVPRPTHKIRFVTAASLFDGHDASINIMRRMLQSSGAEVIHLGHNRSVGEIVTAAIHEDAHAVAVSSYQGGHVEYFKYMVDLLRNRGSGHIKVFGGGGGVIVSAEIRELEKHGVTRIYSPQDGQRMGLQGMIDNMLQHCDFDPVDGLQLELDSLIKTGWGPLARFITVIENTGLDPEVKAETARRVLQLPKAVPVLGITGTGGSGKSSLSDELVLRFRLDYDEKLKIAIVAVDPSRRKTGGALLGDRIRMNAIDAPNVFMRSLATRDAAGELPQSLPDIIGAIKLAGFDLIIVETPGIGQGDAGIVPYVDTSLYVMTPEFGAGSQLEKIDMLDYADVVAINKFDRRGAQDALRDVRKQVQRNTRTFNDALEDMAVYGTTAAHFNDDGVTALYRELHKRLQQLGLPAGDSVVPKVAVKASSGQTAIVPPARQRYLAEIAEVVQAYRKKVEQQVRVARECQQLRASQHMLEQAGKDAAVLDDLVAARQQALDERSRKLLQKWPKLRERYEGDDLVVEIHDKELRTPLTTTSLSGTKVPKVVLPKYEDQGELLRWLLLENVPGSFPYTAGVFAFKRQGEDPTRMFAGEGDAFKTNRRFKYLSEHSEAKRLSTAFDSVTLYGSDPDERPDVYGKIGNSGVSIATLEDMRVLYDGFDLCDPSTSVSMTINGPAPTILAMFLNIAIDQQLAKFEHDSGRRPTDDEAEKINGWTLENVRGTVQADILKEDQGQNTCIFSTEFSLKVMGDIQEYFVHHNVRNFYSVSISGYHIAEAGANPITQLALTLANGFTYVEAYLARGMSIDDFAPNLSFFFSNGMDPEYSVMGRVARRIWATAMRFKYGANKRSQKLKYHIQTSGRSLHAQEIDFNDIRTTLQALIAVYDNCNSLHTNAHDEAITTPTEDSVRRAVAIQLIINREWGLAKCENANQGAFIIEELTDLVEEAVLQEFVRLADRGGVLGAMETGYQRAKIQDESLYYEHCKHDGSLPIIGVNSFQNPTPEEDGEIALARSSEKEKQSQLRRLCEFKARHAVDAKAALDQVQHVVINGGNVFEALMRAVRFCSLGQITQALFEVGGRYRRNM